MRGPYIAGQTKAGTGNFAGLAKLWSRHRGFYLIPACKHPTQGGLTGGQFEMFANFSNRSQTVSTTIDFANDTASASNSVSNLTFTLTDLDSPNNGGYQDQITILAYDINGNLLPVTLTAADSSVVSVTGSTATAIVGGGSSSSGNVNASSGEGNLQVSVTGDVAQLVIVYGN